MATDVDNLVRQQAILLQKMDHVLTAVQQNAAVAQIIQTDVEGLRGDLALLFFWVDENKKKLPPLRRNRSKNQTNGM